MQLPRFCRAASYGSYLSHTYPSNDDRRRKTNGLKVHVIDYRLEGVAQAEPFTGWSPPFLDPAQALY
jgi:hypothetical protein